MFLLSKEEKIAFMKVIYSAMMFDRQIKDEENEILNSLKSEVFNLTDFQKIDLEKEEKIVEEINKINSLIPTIYLFNILYELEKYYMGAKTAISLDYLDKIDNILMKVKMKDEIYKSKLFKFGERINKLQKYNQNKKENSYNKNNKKTENNDFAISAVRKFTKLFK